MRECRFSDYGHNREPGCAIKRALRKGILAQKDWDSYVSNMSEVRHIENRAAKLKAQKKQLKVWSKRAKEMKRAGKIRY